jgi:hypothetical protein
MSEKYPDYDPDDTESKASHTEHAHSCATFEKNNPGGCEACPWKGRIKSPIVLGKEIVRAEETDTQETDGDEIEVYKIPNYPHP